MENKTISILKWIMIAILIIIFIFVIWSTKATFMP